MIIEYLKRNRLILIFSAICLGMVVLVLLQIDKYYYQNAKRDIIQDNPVLYVDQPIGDEMLNDLTQLAQVDLSDPSPVNQKRLRDKIDAILDSPRNNAWRIVIKRTQEESASAGNTEAHQEVEHMSVAREDKLRRHNTFANSLFLKNFTGMKLWPIQGEGTHTDYGKIYLFYTTPLKSPRIEELTTLYRWYCFFFTVAAALLAFATARRVLVPIRNVTVAIDGSTPERTTFIHRPHSRLENLYNRMALDAVIARLQGQMRDEIARRPQMTGWEVVQFICRNFSEQLDPALTGCLEMVAEGPGHIRATGQYLILRRGALRASEDALLEQIDRMFPRDGRGEAEFALPEIIPPIEGALELITDPERGGIRYLFALGVDARLHEGASAALRPMLGRLVELVETGLQTLSLRNQILVQERGRANISLSRNLGHDLTNIIATSKLELMALDRLLGGGAAPEDPRRRAILLESLHGLLRSVRFMQETVNLYRSYAFLQHPKLETHDGNELVRTTLDLFAMSISAKVELRQDLAEGAPRCVVDPRLIKLALFNLFANALEALRKADPEHNSYGWIRVVTGRAENGGLCIAVEDSGAGIMNAAGARAENHEIEKIFELGYTSRRAGGGQGEGLGLNWVRTIVQDLHGGTIVAENIDSGGARFILSFPPLEN